MRSDIEAAVAEKGDAALDDVDGSPGGFQFPGAMGDKKMPEFRATWSFSLEPEADDKTRLVERFRVWTAEAGLPQKLGLPMMGYGVFAMTRKHMLGVKERAESSTANGSSAPSEPKEPVEA